MNFRKTVLAAFVGMCIYDCFYYTIDKVSKKIKSRVKNKSTKIGFQDENSQNKSDEYSPEVSGRKAIGFQMQKE